ncbi:MAG: porin [Deltaproteobacteria bacterium]|nr:porin [Deltaproteobacteria bacterium]
MRILRYVTPVLFVSSPLFAAGMEKSGEGAHVGASLRAELQYDNGEGNKVEGTDASVTQQQGVRANLLLSGDVNDKVSYKAEYMFIPDTYCLGTNVKWAAATFKPVDMFSVRLGCQKVREGGWDAYNYIDTTSIRGKIDYSGLNTGNKNVPHALYTPAIELGFHMFGDLTLQIVDDVQYVGGWNQKAKQTVNLEWRGDFAGIKPVVQYGLYDAEKSWHMDVGLMAEIENLGLTVDYGMITDSNKVAKKEDKLNRFSLELNYMVAHFKPFVYYTMFEEQQDTPDVKTNTGAVQALGFDDNGSLISFGSSFHHFGDNYAPYLAVDIASGKFKEGTDEKTKNNLMLRVGVTAQL